MSFKKIFGWEWELSKLRENYKTEVDHNPDYGHFSDWEGGMTRVETHQWVESTCSPGWTTGPSDAIFRVVQSLTLASALGMCYVRDFSGFTWGHCHRWRCREDLETGCCFPFHCRATFLVDWCCFSTFFTPMSLATQLIVVSLSLSFFSVLQYLSLAVEVEGHPKFECLGIYLHLLGDLHQSCHHRPCRQSNNALIEHDLWQWQIWEFAL